MMMLIMSQSSWLLEQRRLKGSKETEKRKNEHSVDTQMDMKMKMVDVYMKDVKDSTFKEETTKQKTIGSFSFHGLFSGLKLRLKSLKIKITVLNKGTGTVASLGDNHLLDKKQREATCCRCKISSFTSI